MKTKRNTRSVAVNTASTYHTISGHNYEHFRPFHNKDNNQRWKVQVQKVKVLLSILFQSPGFAN